jgi:predicted GH43/DUF377 family glycosyl hydrolase
MYTGFDGTPGERAAWEIGHATSSDLVHWTKDPNNPVITVGHEKEWDRNLVERPSLFYEGETFHVLYEGSDGYNFRIGHATSPDCLVWIKDTANPVLGIGPEGSWDSLHVRGPGVLRQPDTYHVFYRGDNGTVRSIGHAWSPNLIDWTKSPEDPILRPSDSGWDSRHVMDPSVVRDGNSLKMLYQGYNRTNSIGLASSDI